MSSHGQKVTTDPESNNPVYEGGFVTSDSLAAESANSGGAFGQGNPRVGVSKQPSASTTTNTYDDSAADRLEPSTDSAHRSGGEESFDKGRVEQFTHETSNAGDFKRSGGDSYQNTKSSSGNDYSEDRSSKTNDSTTGDDSGFDGPNASFNNEIGTINDPGRVAEETFIRRNQDGVGSSGRTKDQELDGEGTYDALQDESTS